MGIINNLIFISSNPWGRISYHYDEENRQLRAGGRVFEYDPNGNRVRETLGGNEAQYFDGTLPVKM